MRASKWGRWVALLGIVVGCNAKLSVEPGTGGAGGMTAVAGNAGAGAGTPDDNGGAMATAGSSGALDGGGNVNGGASGAPGGAPGGGVPGGGAPGGGAGAPPVPGQDGQPCIPGETADSGSGVTATKITSLPRCSPGLACNSAGKCAAIPQCPQTTGKCLEYGSPGQGGQGGTSGEGGAPGGGAAGAHGGAAGTGSTIDPIATPDESGVTGMALDGTRLYWTEYGTRDALGNYQNDGALMTKKLADGTTAQLGAKLAGPNALAITGSHAYVIVDGAALVGTVSHPQLMRLSLADGTLEVIQSGSPPILQTSAPSFVAVGNTMYWSGTGSYYSLASGSTTPTAGASYATALHADSSNLYFVNVNNVLARTLLTGGGAIEPLNLDTRPFDLNGDSIYGLEFPQGGMILTKAAKDNGTWLRVRALGEAFPTGLVFVGDRFFATWTDSSQRTGITTATLSSAAAPTRLIDPSEGTVKTWIASSSKLYWSDGPGIFSRAIPTP